MDREQPDTRLARRIIEIALIATAVAVWRSANDAFNIVKLTILLLCALAVALISVRRALATGRVQVPRSMAAIGVVLFLGVGGVAVLTSDATWRSLLGVYGRSTGYATYLAGGVLFLGVLRNVGVDRAPRVARAALIAAGLVAAYGLLQRLGADPYEWTTPYGPDAATSTLGNTNFVSGYLGAALPLGVWATVAYRDRARLLAGAATLVAALGIFAARSQQGLVAAAAGLAVLGVVIAFEYGGARRRQIIGGILALAFVAGIALGAGLTGSGPLGRLNDTGYEYRRYYWSAALEMAGDKPLTGVGFDRWAAHYRLVRPEEAAVGASDTTDEPHSVPLNMLASGGYPLGLAYAAFAASIAIALLVGLQRTSGQQRLLLGGVGGAWVGYQLQSTVSIDVPALPVLHFVVAGLIVVLAQPVRFSQLDVPLVTRTVERRTSKRNVEVRSVPRFASWQATVVVAALGAIGLWQLTRPLRADLEIRSAHSQLERGDLRAASDDLRSAFDLWDREPEYLSMAGAVFGRQQQAAIAQRYFERAIAMEPRRFSDTLNAARAAEASQDATAAARHYARALELEPQQLDLKWEVGEFYSRIGKLEDAEELVAQATAIGRPAVFVLLGNIRAALDDVEGADNAYDQALELGADDPGTLAAVASAKREAGDLEAARELGERALELSPGRPSLLYELGLTLEALGDIAGAIEAYDAAAAVDYNGDFPDAAERAAELRAQE